MECIDRVNACIIADDALQRIVLTGVRTLQKVNVGKPLVDSRKTGGDKPLPYEKAYGRA